MTESTAQRRMQEARSVLAQLDLPRKQLNDRSVLCLLALLDLTPDKPWRHSGNPLMGITPIMDWIRRHYARDYAPNTRETIRRQTMHQFVAAGIALYNPDKPDRPVNSPKAVYQIEPNVLLLLKSYGTRTWPQRLKQYLENNATLAKQYAQARLQTMIPVKIAPDTSITLSPGSHNELVRRIIEDFAPRFAPGGTVVYVGDTEDKWAYFDNTLLASLEVEVDAHGKMPDVILLCCARNWLFLIQDFRHIFPSLLFS